jgi:hypothetical protein
MHRGRDAPSDTEWKRPSSIETWPILEGQQALRISTIRAWAMREIVVNGAAVCGTRTTNQSARSRIGFSGFAKAHDVRHELRRIRVRRFTRTFVGEFGRNAPWSFLRRRAYRRCMRRKKPPFERRLKCCILFARFDRRLLPIGRCEPPLASWRETSAPRHNCVRSRRAVVLICPGGKPARQSGTGAGSSRR